MPPARLRFRAPVHCHAVAHGGETIAVASDGSIEADEDAAASLLAHGFRPWREEEPKPALETLSRADLVAALRCLGIVASATTRTADLRRRLDRAITDALKS